MSYAAVCLSLAFRCYDFESEVCFDWLDVLISNADLNWLVLLITHHSVLITYLYV
jgi:hypothetical protein